MQQTKKPTRCLNKVFAVLNVILIAETMVSCIFYSILGGINLKGLTSLGFALVGAVNLIYAVKARVLKLRFSILMTIGLFICMIADIVLNFEFIIGALIFALGHIFYFASYCSLVKFKIKDLIPTAVIFTASAAVILAVPIFDFGSTLMESICILYALVISCMLGKAISNLIRNRNNVNTIISLGSVLFFFSDLMLLFHVFAGASEITDILCLFSYYPAQCLLAHSVYRLTKKEI